MSADPSTADVRRTTALWVIQAVFGLVAYGLIIFVSVGRLGWIWGWALLLVVAVAALAPVALLVRRDPGLLVERRRGSWSADVERWDRVITALAGALMISTWVVAGLDTRWGWTGAASLWVHVAGLVATAGGYGLFLWAMVSNPFFSKGVRIQEERGHVVAAGGPYRYVRHPGYSGAIVAALGTPVLLGSIWAVVPGAALATVFVLRTALEDRVLTQRLSGYEAYKDRVPYRLVPRVW